MSSYNKFAYYYDRLTENVDYEVRSDYISGFFNRNEKKLLDLACGTGSITKLLYDKGFEVTGVDISEDMLTVASSKCAARFIKGDMRTLQFNNEFDACVCLLDSINHLESKEDWQSCFESIHRALKENGLFVFDVNTVFKHNQILADNAFIFDEEDFYLAWDNEYVGSNKIRIILDLFAFNGKNYYRYSEEFTEKAYEIDEIKEMLSGLFDIKGIYDDLTHNPPNEESERVFFICKRI